MGNEEVVFRVINGITRPIKEFEPTDKRANIVFTELYRKSNDGTKEYVEAKEYLLDHGRGLGLKAEEDLTEEDKHILDIIDKKAIESPYNILAYRTDDTPWLNKYKPGDSIPIDSILFTTLDKDIVIPENTNKVLQRTTIQIPKGTKVFSINNGNEMELDVVRGQYIKIIEHDMQGTTYSYTVKIKDKE